MGRPPCCDKVGVKKGPWTPEEDIMLVSYVQENGPGNWRAVPATTGLRRCSKSCRLRWTNYLRPGIKRGSFTDQEEKMIIQLQALLGNKWAAIAAYLPERTDNDIKNYWNTHLKKKLKRLQNGTTIDQSRVHDKELSSKSHSISRGQWERRLQDDISTAKQALKDAVSSEDVTNLSESTTLCCNESAPYASSTENIARLLKTWVKSTPKKSGESSSTQNSSSDKSGVDLSEAFESLFGFSNLENSNSDEFSRSASPSMVLDEIKSEPNLNVLENWLFDAEMKDYFTNLCFVENPDELF
ncbi:hypothetical protein ACS0TY_028371 [Phlomoides rotata]